MAYQTNTVSSFADLKADVLAFLAANGYTQEGSDLIKKGNLYATLTTDTYYLEMRGAKRSDGVGNLVEPFDGPNRNVTWSNPGCRVVEKIQGNSGGVVTMSWPITYHFHLSTNPDEFWCFLEYNGGYCQHFGFGNIIKSAPFTGGGFYTSSFSRPQSSEDSNSDTDAARWSTITNTLVSVSQGYYNHSGAIIPFNYTSYGGVIKDYFGGSAIHAEIDGVEWFGNTLLSSDDIFPNNLKLLPNGAFSYERSRSQSPINGITSLAPFRIMAGVPGRNVQQLGRINSLRFCKLGNLNFGQVESDGTDSWKFYPLIVKSPDADDSDTTFSDGTSGLYGLAVRYDGP